MDTIPVHCTRKCKTVLINWGNTVHVPCICTPLLRGGSNVSLTAWNVLYKPTLTTSPHTFQAINYPLSRQVLLQTTIITVHTQHTHCTDTQVGLMTILLPYLPLFESLQLYVILSNNNLLLIFLLSRSSNPLKFWLDMQIVLYTFFLSPLGWVEGQLGNRWTPEVLR